MSNYNLSEGSLAVIMTGGNVEDPIVQVLGHKKIMGSAEKERYRLLVSDGKYQISFAMIATQLNDKITSGDLTTHSVIKIKKYITSMINNAGKGDRRVMVILDLEIIKCGEEVGCRIGNPVALPDDPSVLLKGKPASNGVTSTNVSSEQKFTVPGAAPSSTSGPAPSPSAAPAPKNTFIKMNVSEQATVPLANLSPYQNKWVARVRVLNKTPVRTWSNSRGEGKLFSVDFADETAEIRATAFRDLVDKFYDLLQIDMVYYISKLTVKTANKAFTNIKHDYELTFNNDSTVTQCTDEICIPGLNYKFVPISNIIKHAVGDIIDVIGVCKFVSEVQTLTARSTNRELKKREITLMDTSNNSVQLTLWGTEAENFNGNDQPVIVIRGAKVGEFGGGKNLSVLVSSVMKQNPDIPEAHQLKGWFESCGKHIDTANISARSGAGNMRTNWMSLFDVKEKRLGSGENADYYQCKATILLVNTNNAVYKACPTEECNKKVVDLENGQFRCEKCNREYPSFKYRMIMTLNIGDWSDSQWVSMFANEAEKVLGMTSQEFGEATENDKEALATICGQVNFTEYIFRCRAKLETFNDETRLKNIVMRIDPINYREYNNLLISSIKKVHNL